MTSEHVPDIGSTFEDSWGGSIKTNSIVSWIDLSIAMVKYDFSHTLLICDHDLLVSSTCHLKDKLDFLCRL